MDKLIVESRENEAIKMYEFEDVRCGYIQVMIQNINSSIVYNDWDIIFIQLCYISITLGNTSSIFSFSPSFDKSATIYSTFTPYYLESSSLIFFNLS